jgi:hypothetical protein
VTLPELIAVSGQRRQGTPRLPGSPDMTADALAIRIIALGKVVGGMRALTLCRNRSRLAYSSMAPPICRKCRRKVYDGSAARRARYSPKVVCWRRV